MVAKQITLPYPPSLNRYWRNIKGRTLISANGREYRKAVQAIVMGIEPTASRLAVRIDVYPPDRRKRDLDNIPKAVLDALQHGGVYEDDGQIDDLHIVRRGVMRPGMVLIQIASIGDEN